MFLTTLLIMAVGAAVRDGNPMTRLDMGRIGHNFTSLPLDFHSSFKPSPNALHMTCNNIFDPLGPSTRDSALLTVYFSIGKV
jgi:hypothetical protein